MAHPGFTLCLCPDSRLMRDQVHALLVAHPPAEAGPGASAPEWERHSYWGDDPLPDAFWEALTLGGLFSIPKALVVHNAQNLPADAWKRLSVALSQARDHSWPLFCLNVDFERGKPKIPAHLAKLPCFIFAEKKGWLWSSPGLDARSQSAFVRSEAKRLGLTFPPAMAEALVRRLPLDATAIGTEMEKLALTAGQDGSLPATALDMLDHEPDMDIFALMRALQQGNASGAVWRQILASQQGSDSLTFSFLAMLAREARQLWQLLAGEPVRLPPQVLNAKENLARALGFVGIARIWRLALEADKGVKSGERSPDQALERLIADLFILFAPRRSR